MTKTVSRGKRYLSQRRVKKGLHLRSQRGVKKGRHLRSQRGVKKGRHLRSQRSVKKGGAEIVPTTSAPDTQQQQQEQQQQLQEIEARMNTWHQYYGDIDGLKNFFISKGHLDKLKQFMISKEEFMKSETVTDTDDKDKEIGWNWSMRQVILDSDRDIGIGMKYACWPKTPIFPEEDLSLLAEKDKLRDWWNKARESIENRGLTLEYFKGNPKIFVEGKGTGIWISVQRKEEESNIYTFSKGKQGYGMWVSDAAVVLSYSVTGGPAEIVGLPIGGKIVEINGVPVDGKVELKVQLEENKDKDEINFTCTNPAEYIHTIEFGGEEEEINLAEVSWCIPEMQGPDGTIVKIQEILPEVPKAPGNDDESDENFNEICVSSVVHGQQAYDKGIRKGDRITKVNGLSVDMANGLTEVAYQLGKTGGKKDVMVKSYTITEKVVTFKQGEKLGMRVRVDFGSGKHPVSVSRVVHDGAAFRNAIREGDKIIQVNNKIVKYMSKAEVMKCDLYKETDKRIVFHRTSPIRMCEVKFNKDEAIGMEVKFNKGEEKDKKKRREQKRKEQTLVVSSIDEGITQGIRKNDRIMTVNGIDVENMDPTAVLQLVSEVNGSSLSSDKEFTFLLSENEAALRVLQDKGKLAAKVFADRCVPPVFYNEYLKAVDEAERNEEVEVFTYTRLGGADGDFGFSFSNVSSIRPASAAPTRTKPPGRVFSVSDKEEIKVGDFIIEVQGQPVSTQLFFPGLLRARYPLPRILPSAMIIPGSDKFWETILDAQRRKNGIVEMKFLRPAGTPTQESFDAVINNTLLNLLGEAAPREEEEYGGWDWRSASRNLMVKGVKYTGDGKVGDYGWMLEREEYDHSLMIFNENVQQLLSNDKNAGKGNAVARPYRNGPNGYNKAIGIPTGFLDLVEKGFYSLTQQCLVKDRSIVTAQDLIDMTINEIVELLATERTDATIIYYSTDNDGRTLGSGVFNIAPEVKDYITNEIHKIPEKVEFRMKMGQSGSPTLKNTGLSNTSILPKEERQEKAPAWERGDLWDELALRTMAWSEWRKQREENKVRGENLKKNLLEASNGTNNLADIKKPPNVIGIARLKRRNVFDENLDEGDLPIDNTDVVFVTESKENLMVGFKVDDDNNIHAGTFPPWVVDFDNDISIYTELLNRVIPGDIERQDTAPESSRR